MAFIKIFIFAICFVASRSAAVRKGILIAEPVNVEVGQIDPAPQYTFAYDVNDALSGDAKNHIESRNGDVVKGQYSLIDPDGTRRTVEYTADPINGFNAKITRTEVAQTVEPVRIKAAPVVVERKPKVLVETEAAEVEELAPIAVQKQAPVLVETPTPVAKLRDQIVEVGPVRYAVAPLRYSAIPIKLAVSPAKLKSTPIPISAPVFAKIATAPVIETPVVAAPLSARLTVPAPVKLVNPVEFTNPAVYYSNNIVAPSAYTSSFFQRF